HQRLFVCLAILVPVKGHSDLLRAFRAVHETCRDARLALLGDGPLRAALEEQTRRHGTSAAVRFAGHVPYERVPDWIAAADALVLPSLNEGTPLAALESLTSGRPVVGTRVGGIPEVVRDETLGRVVGPGDPEALAAAMREVLDVEWDVERLHARGTEYAWSRLMQEVLSIYRELLP
ncbi:MAG: glycosyltransferase, partial [Acidobacteriota bacterium]|nr:glycosyltransferase [Acidobacteriota bacterium]